MTITPPLVKETGIGERGRDSLVTPTRRDGKANSDAAPWITAQTAAASDQAAQRTDLQPQILAALRTLIRVNAAGFGLSEMDADAILTEEMNSVITF